MNLRKIITLLIVGFWAVTVLGQTLDGGKKVEYYLSGQDAHSGKFYLGRFNIGTYEVLCNVMGSEANNCGWKIIVGRNWGRGISMNELYNNLGGSFYYQADGNTGFHLWWYSNFNGSNVVWSPHVKVTFQRGSLNITSIEPNVSESLELTSIIDQRSSNINISGLRVNGTIRAEEIIVAAKENTADFVFEPNYQLKDLSQVESFIRANKHLENIPSARQMEEQGVNLIEMNKSLLQKVEELTLYSIELEKARIRDKEEREKLEANLKNQHKQVETMSERLAKIEALLMRDADK